MRERAVRMMFVHEGEYPSQYKAIDSIAQRLDVEPETLRIRVRLAGRPQLPSGYTSDERSRVKLL